MKILLVAGARPNFMKIAPIVREIRAKAQVEVEVKAEAEVEVEWRLVHTGQHYDYEMSQAFF